jgi:hypothetical protein
VSSLRLLSSWLGIALAGALSSTIACASQEVGFVDLTLVEARADLRHPAPRTDEVSERRGGASMLYDCEAFPKAPRGAGTLRTTLVWLDRSEYAVGDSQKFEVQIEKRWFSPNHNTVLTPSGRPPTRRSESEVRIFSARRQIVGWRLEMEHKCRRWTRTVWG